MYKYICHIQSKTRDQVNYEIDTLLTRIRAKFGAGRNSPVGPIPTDDAPRWRVVRTQYVQSPANKFLTGRILGFLGAVWSAAGEEKMWEFMHIICKVGTTVPNFPAAPQRSKRSRGRALYSYTPSQIHSRIPLGVGEKQCGAIETPSSDPIGGHHTEREFLLANQ
jgi:hypothetical protein